MPLKRGLFREVTMRKSLQRGLLENVISERFFQGGHFKEVTSEKSFQGDFIFSYLFKFTKLPLLGDIVYIP